jgi:aminoglycoside phosphotransferase (APT) family kinase protein
MALLKQPFDAYLKHRIGPDAVLVSEQRFSRGSSRITWFVDYRVSPDQPVQSVVFRGDHAGGSTIATSLEQEYFMYERLGHTAVPVAKALWWEDDSEWVERPFYVRERIEGSWDVPHFGDPDPKYDQLRIEISKEHLSKLALVHTVDWKTLGFDARLSAPKSKADCAAHFVDLLVSQLESFREEPIPLVLEAVDWLKRHAPEAPSISLCKGTNGLGEEILRDGVIVAMSDWEEASIGDPAADFASLQNFVPEIERDGRRLWGMDHAVAYYREVSGIPLAVGNVRYYQIVRALSTLVFSHKAAVITHHGDADIRQPWTGTECLLLGKRVLLSAMGLGPPVGGGWLNDLNESIS